MRQIRKIAVLGSGIMGSRLACHMANAGYEVLLLDIVPKEAADSKKPAERNQLVNDALKSAIKSNPAPLYDKKFAKRITTGNFDDDLPKVAEVDWILEAIIENLDIKNGLFEKVEKFRKPGTLITSNTSGIPIAAMAAPRSDDFKQHFMGTHFFNPPRYLPLLELIPTKDTLPEVLDFFTHFGDVHLGKRTVQCKDTPAFIANRVGVFSIMAIFHLMQESGLSIEGIDYLTGPLTGKPKSATFRTCDLVGIDTLVKVAEGVAKGCPDDEAGALFKTPEFVQKMVAAGLYGDKSGSGFYKKSRDAEGKRVIQTLNLTDLSYRDKKRDQFSETEAVRGVDDLRERLSMLHAAKGPGADFIRKLNRMIFSYVCHRIPEISDEVYRIDDAIKAGFGWEIGPFESWDLFGVAGEVEAMQAEGIAVAPWVTDMLAAGHTSFYKLGDQGRLCYDTKGSYAPVPSEQNLIILDHFREKKPVFQNAGTTIHDLGDGILNLSIHTKMNTIGGEVIEGLNKAVDLAESEYQGLVIGGAGANFSAGANLGMVFMLAVEQEFDELDYAVRVFQNINMRLKYSSVPVVVVPVGLTLGGGCEMTLHADAAVCAAETYIGLVEVGVGLIPGGGGTKEFVVRSSDSYYEGDPKLPTLQQRFTTIATAKVATSAEEAFGLGILDKGHHRYTMSGRRALTEAKAEALILAQAGYVAGAPRNDIHVLGRSALGTLYAGAEAFHVGRYASEHDLKIARKLAYVMCGGDLSQPTEVSEQYLLNLEREAFLSLLGETKTLERMQSVLKTGKPVRN